MCRLGGDTGDSPGDCFIPVVIVIHFSFASYEIIMINLYLPVRIFQMSFSLPHIFGSNFLVIFHVLSLSWLDLDRYTIFIKKREPNLDLENPPNTGLTGEGNF